MTDSHTAPDQPGWALAAAQLMPGGLATAVSASQQSQTLTSPMARTLVNQAVRSSLASIYALDKKTRRRGAGF